MKKRFKIILIVVSALLLALVMLYLVYHSVLKQLYPVGYTAQVEAAAEEFSLDPLLIYAVINCESSYDPQAVSEAGAIGLMQITEDTFHWAQSRLDGSSTLDKGELFDPDTNIRYGSYILSLHLNEFGSTELALAAYHAGRGSVQDWLSNDSLTSDGESLHTIPFSDTDRYVKWVTQTLSVYRTLYG